MMTAESATPGDENDDLSSLGDASPLDDGAVLQAQKWQQCRSRVQKYCSISFACIYMLVYLSLSSNPKVAVLSNGYQFDVRMPALQQDTTPHFNSTTNFGVPHEAEIKRRNQHINQVASTIARTYTPVSPSVWCIDGRLKFEFQKQRPTGLCYVQVPKAASSTLAGINVRVAHNFAKRQGLQKSCIRHDGPAPGYFYRQRETKLSYLWTFVRDPTARALSRVASNAAKNRVALETNTHNETVITDYVLQALTTATDERYGTISQGQGGFQLRLLHFRFLEEYSSWNASQPTHIHKIQKTQKIVQEILERYDFIGVVERFEESLVALQLLLGLETSDILYLSASETGLDDDETPYFGRSVAGGNFICQKTVHPSVLQTPQVQEYIQSTPWWAQHYGDHLLHQAASQSLDRTILAIGLHEFSRAYKKFKAMQAQAREQCHAIFPCSNNGTAQVEQASKNCYFEDIGCGYPCLDALQEEKEENSETEEEEANESTTE